MEKRLALTELYDNVVTFSGVTPHGHPTSHQMPSRDWVEMGRPLKISVVVEAVSA